MKAVVVAFHNFDIKIMFKTLNELETKTAQCVNTFQIKETRRRTLQHVPAFRDTSASSLPNARVGITFVVATRVSKA